MRGKAQREPAGANSPAKLRGYWTKLHQSFVKRRWVIGGVNARIHVAIFPSVVECQRIE